MGADRQPPPEGGRGSLRPRAIHRTEQHGEVEPRGRRRAWESPAARKASRTSAGKGHHGTPEHRQRSEYRRGPAPEASRAAAIRRRTSTRDRRGGRSKHRGGSSPPHRSWLQIPWAGQPLGGPLNNGLGTAGRPAQQAIHLPAATPG